MNSAKIQFSTVLRVFLFVLAISIFGFALKIKNPASDLIFILNFVFCSLVIFLGHIHYINSLRRFLDLDDVWFTPLAFLVWAGLGFLWAVLAMLYPPFGVFVSILFLGITAFNLIFSKQWKNHIDNCWRNPDLMIPVYLTLVIGVVYLVFTFATTPDWRSTGLGDGPLGLLPERFNLNMSSDYLIQYQFGNLLVDGTRFWGLVVDSYNTTLADRPPLLAAMSLLFNSTIPESLRFYFFMPAAILAQLSWISFVWLTLRKLANPSRRSIAVVLFLSVFGYIFCNSVFCWPKFLGGSLIGFAAILSITKPLNHRFTLILVGFFSILGFFAHGGSSVSLLPIGLLILQQIKTFKIKKLILPFIIFLIPIAIYSGLKKKFEPQAPGLFRFLVVDHENPSIYRETSKTLYRAIAESYAGKDISDLVLLKLHNFLSLLERPVEGFHFSPYSLFPREGFQWVQWSRIWHSLDVDNFFRSLGLLLLGLFGFRSAWNNLSNSSKSLMKKLLFIAVTSLVFNVLVTYDPDGIRLTYFSYTGNLLFFTILALGVFSLEKTKVLILFLIQILYFLTVWIFSPKFISNDLDFTVIFGSMAILSLFYFATRSFKFEL